jgi:hypothetical protein
LKPSGIIKSDPDEWLDYTAASLAKLNLPGTGIWKIYLDDAYKAMAFEMLEGTLEEPLEITPNPTEIVIHGKERDFTSSEQEGGTGQPWDNQFFIKAERKLAAGEATVISFEYRSTVSAKTSTQCHAAPGGYIHWAAIGDVNFTTDWQTFEAAFTVPSECAGKGFKSIAFNLAEIKDANDYTFTDLQWYLKSDEAGKTRENLINATGQQNFAWKVVGGEIITGIKEVAVKKNVSTATYNLAGQRVSDSFKGIVIKDGKKYVK